MREKFDVVLDFVGGEGIVEFLWCGHTIVVPKSEDFVSLCYTHQGCQTLRESKLSMGQFLFREIEHFGCELKFNKERVQSLYLGMIIVSA